MHVKQEKNYNKFEKEVMEKVSILKNTLNLQNWEIMLLDNEPEDEENIASITPLPGMPTAGLSLRKDLKKASDDQLMAVLVHELVHLHFERACSSLDFGLQILDTDPTVKKALDQIGLNHHMGIEHGVEGVARVIANLLKK